MVIETELADFANDVLQEVIARSEIEDEEDLRENQFTEVMIDHLVEAGELDDGITCFHRAHGVKVNGYSMSDDGDRLDLFVCEPVLDGFAHSIGKTAVDTAFNRVHAFLEKALAGYHKGLEESSDGYDLSSSIWRARDDLVRVRLFVFTDGLSRVEEISNTALGDVEISYHLWDLRRLYRSVSSGTGREPVIIDFTEIFGEALPCFYEGSVSQRYQIYFVVMPGEMLVELYSRFGPRLLERNVRSFLQLRGNVNKGIRTTILDEPEMFLAYNNGLSSTASIVETVNQQNGSLGISKVVDFQIVNGGQTTGSLYSAARKDKADLSRIQVPMKLTEIIDTRNIEDIAPKISQYANTQNRVNMADFSANHPFHVALQELSRTVWAPATEGIQRQTRWYYERARGQYLDEKSRETTPARKKAFEAMNPPRQRFSKTDLAKYENTWSQFPHLVSLGAQKNFLKLMEAVEKRSGFKPDEGYFRRLVAKAILFKRAEKIVSAQKLGGYRANIVTYTLAWLSRYTQQRIDLERIWKQQKLSSAMDETIQRVCLEAHRHITNPPGGANVTEWCKRPSCWKTFQEVKVELLDGFDQELLQRVTGSEGGPGQPGDIDQGIETETPEEIRLIEELSGIPAARWFAIASWAKETDNLEGWQRRIAFSLGRRAATEQPPTRKQAVQGKRILDEVNRLGFQFQATSD